MKHNHERLLVCLVLVSIAGFIMQGCARTQEAFLTVQVCPVVENDVDQFEAIMRMVAKQERLRFIDNSQRTRDALEAMGTDDTLEIDLARIIDLHIEGEKGLGATASNVGLTSNQIAIGFTRGSNAAKAHRLSDRLIAALSARWDVRTIPKGEGVLPTKNCGA